MSSTATVAPTLTLITSPAAPAPAPAGPSVAPAPTALDSSKDAVSVDTFPSAPPPEVLTAVQGALAISGALADRGLGVSFGTGADGRFGAALADGDGRPLAALRPSDVLGLADGSLIPTTRTADDVDDGLELD